MPARRGPRVDQIDQFGAIPGEVVTATVSGAPDWEPGGGTGTGGGGGGDIVQEIILGEVITDVDQAISTQLSQSPINAQSVQLFFNGVLQAQGTNLAYIVSSTDDRSLIWLAGSGTAVNSNTLDTWIVVYEV